MRFISIVLMSRCCMLSKWFQAFIVFNYKKWDQKLKKLIAVCVLDIKPQPISVCVALIKTPRQCAWYMLLQQTTTMQLFLLHTSELTEINIIANMFYFLPQSGDKLFWRGLFGEDCYSMERSVCLHYVDTERDLQCVWGNLWHCRKIVRRFCRATELSFKFQQ